MRPQRALNRPPQPVESKLAEEAGRLGRLLLPPLLAGAVFFLVLSFWLVPMIRETRQFSFMVRPATDLYILSASVMDFLVPNRLHTLFRPESFAWIGNQISPVSERTISIGYIALALAVVGALIWRRRAGLWIAGALFFFAMALGPVIHFGNITAAEIPEATELPLHFTPFGILAYFSDFVRLSRSVSRYAVMVQLCVSVLAGMGLAALLTRLQAARAPQTQGGRTVSAVALLCLGLILAEYWVAPYPMSAPDTPTWYGTLTETPEQGAVLNLPMNYDRPGYLLYQTVHQRPLTVAYISRDDPRTLTERAPVLQHFRHLGPDILAVDPAALGSSVLADLDVEYVVLDRYKMPGGLEREYTTALATEIFAGQAPVFEDDRITVYRVVQPATKLSYPQLGALNWGPLTEEADGQRARAVLGPAELSFVRAPAGAQIRLRYRTRADAGAVIDLAGDAQMVPPAPQGGEFVISLPQSDDDEPVSITLRPDEPGQLWIEQVELLSP